MNISQKKKRCICNVSTIFRDSSVSRERGCQGFTLVEVLIVLAVIGALATIAIPNFTKIKGRVLETRCVAEISGLQKSILAYTIDYDEWPASLDFVGAGDLEDPWGRPYQYLVISSAPDDARYLIDDLNTDYDLYSLGSDGVFDPDIADPSSQDDIVRASNGSFLGLVSQFF